MEGEVFQLHLFLTEIPDAVETHRFTPWRRSGQAGERKNLLHPAEVEPPNFRAGGLLTTMFSLTVIVTPLSSSHSVYVYVYTEVCRKKVILAVKYELPSACRLRGI